MIPALCRFVSFACSSSLIAVLTMLELVCAFVSVYTHNNTYIFKRHLTVTPSGSARNLFFLSRCASLKFDVFSVILSFSIYIKVWLLLHTFSYRKMNFLGSIVGYVVVNSTCLTEIQTKVNITILGNCSETSRTERDCG